MWGSWMNCLNPDFLNYCRLDRFFDIEAWNTPGHRYTIALQDFFALILVDFHGDLGWVTYAALMLSQRS